MYKAIITVGLMIFCSVGYAEKTRYVSDILEIPMRAGKATKYRIVRMLKSGTPLTVLEEDNSGYSKVKTGDTEGWVLTRFLMATPSARNRLQAAEEKAVSLEIQNNNLREEVTQLNARLKDAQQNVQRLTSDNNRLEDRLTQLNIATADEQRILTENKKFKEELRANHVELKDLESENERLRDRRYQQGFLHGAAILVLGLLLGIFAPKFRPKKRSQWDGGF